MKQLTKRTAVVVTGASLGISRATAIALAAEKARFIVQ
jgi:NAD(P)-dependent dehydrogenase (short-subunit alcohol dehydrogenase family)